MKTHKLKFLVVLAASSATSPVFCQALTDEEARNIASSFASSIGVSNSSPYSVSRITSPVSQKIRILVSSGKRHFIIDQSAATVVSYIDEELMSRLRQPNELHGGAASLQTVLTRTRQLLSQIGPGRNWHVAQSSLTSNQLSRGQEYRIRAEEVIGGVQTKGNGNRISIVFDAATLGISELNLSVNHQYEPATASITQFEAVTRANNILRSLDPSLLSEVRSVRLRYSAPMRGFGNSNFPAQVNARRVFYVYSIRFDRCLVNISASNGQCVGGLRIPR